MVITVFIALSAIVKDIQFQFSLNSVAMEVKKKKITWRKGERPKIKEKEKKRKGEQFVCVAIFK